jgi:hypothetical protein
MSHTANIAERNARASARGEYMRWLAKRFGDIDLLLTLQGEDRVSLRKIYVPLRLDTEDRSDESMGGPADIAKEQLPGRDALDLIAEQPFVAISGRPGSGKTTLVQAIIGELTSDRPSEFRVKLVGNRGILPIPLILRDYLDELPGVETLDDLLGCWWGKAQREAQDKGFRLDLDRLRQSYAQEGDGMPLLLVFDGIDEAGGPDLRGRVLKLAAEAAPRGYRVLCTGRPAGYQGLELGPDGIRAFENAVLRLAQGPIPVSSASSKWGGPDLALIVALFHAAATPGGRAWPRIRPLCITSSPSPGHRSTPSSTSSSACARSGRWSGSN